MIRILDSARTLRIKFECSVQYILWNIWFTRFEQHAYFQKVWFRILMHDRAFNKNMRFSTFCHCCTRTLSLNFMIIWHILFSILSIILIILFVTFDSNFGFSSLAEHQNQSDSTFCCIYSICNIKFNSDLTDSIFLIRIFNSALLNMI